MNELVEIPASWVADAGDPGYDEYLAQLEEDELEERLERQHQEFLRAWYYKGVM